MLIFGLCAIILGAVLVHRFPGSAGARVPFLVAAVSFADEWLLQVGYIGDSALSVVLVMGLGVLPSLVSAATATLLARSKPKRSLPLVIAAAVGSLLICTFVIYYVLGTIVARQ